jgi:hypothetical protein
MCQNWYAIIGQLLDVVGFIIIAIEWHHQFKRDHDRRIGELQKAYEQQAAENAGEVYDDADSDKYNWRIYQKLFLTEWEWRRNVFYTGASLVILGFLFQALGNWPHLFRSC